MNRSELESALDALLTKHEHMIKRQIDAVTCRAPSDWKHAHAAEAAYADAREAFLDRVADQPYIQRRARA